MDRGDANRLAGKPYGFVPIAPQVVRTIVPGHNELRRDRYHGVIELQIEALQPVHIGTGEYRVGETGMIVAGFHRSADTLVIPGSSLKGCIRAISEAASASCSPSLTNGRRPSELPQANQRPCNGGTSGREVCSACGLFGFMESTTRYKGRVSFGDFPAVEPVRPDHLNLAQLQGPHPGIDAIYRDPDSGLLRGRKFYYHGRGVDSVAKRGRQVYEVVPKGTRFTGELRFQNLTRPELSLLCFAMGLDGTFAPKIGYGKPAYLGSIKLSVVSAVVRKGFAPEPGADTWLPDLAAQHANAVPALAGQIAALRRILDVRSPNGPGWDRETGGY